MLNKIHIFISIFAALIVTIINIIEGLSLSVLSFRIINVIIVFYFIGIFIRYFLKKNVFYDKPAEENPDQNVEQDNIVIEEPVITDNEMQED